VIGEMGAGSFLSSDF